MRLIYNLTATFIQSDLQNRECAEKQPYKHSRSSLATKWVIFFYQYKQIQPVLKVTLLIYLFSIKFNYGNQIVYRLLSMSEI